MSIGTWCLIYGNLFCIIKLISNRFLSFESQPEWDLYGDNILECWRLVEYALKGEYEIDIKGELNVIEPTINLIKNNSQIKLNLFLRSNDVSDLFKFSKLNLKKSSKNNPTA